VSSVVSAFGTAYGGVAADFHLSGISLRGLDVSLLRADVGLGAGAMG